VIFQKNGIFSNAAVGNSKFVVTIYQPTLCDIPDDWNLLQHRCGETQIFAILSSVY
jgi:hypothetical protein